MTPHKPIEIDVRPLIEAGIEPRPQLFEAVQRLAPGQRLSVLSPFVPSPLIERLRSDGFTVTLARRADGAWETRFTKPA
jgi:uncharacterized protein (DUF2249 family)